MDWIQKLTHWRERQDQILEIYEAGVPVPKIVEELQISRSRFYQIIKKAKKRREEKVAQDLKEQTMDVDE